MRARIPAWVLPAGLAALALILGRTMLANVLQFQRIRVDADGDGHFGSRRDGHTHQGVDIVAVPGEFVQSPVAGRVVRVTHPYPGDPNYTGIVLQGEGMEVKLFYVFPLRGLAIGAEVERGEPIGLAQDVTVKYGGAPMLPHIHVELRRSVGGDLLNPEHLFAWSA